MPTLRLYRPISFRECLPGACSQILTRINGRIVQVTYLTEIDANHIKVYQPETFTVLNIEKDAEWDRA